MLAVSLADRLVERARSLDRARRELQTLSAETLAMSKRAIFAFHRDDRKTAEAELKSASERLATGRTIIKKETRLAQEGAWRAAQEEFSEADLLRQYLKNRQIVRVKEVSDDTDIFIGAVSDLTGELVRRAVLLASQRSTDEIERIFLDVSGVVDFLLRMDLTGNLRTKVDQAKQNLRKLEEIRYDLALRQQG